MADGWIGAAGGMKLRPRALVPRPSLSMVMEMDGWMNGAETLSESVPVFCTTTTHLPPTTTIGQHFPFSSWTSNSCRVSFLRLLVG